MSRILTKPRRGRPPGGGGEKVLLHVEVPAGLKKALVRLAGRNRRKITGELLIALTAHLRANGVWPPPGEDDV
jgi:hypothetical protein